MNSVFCWQNARTKKSLILSPDVMQAAGITDEEKLMAIVFEYVVEIAVKVINWEPQSSEKVWMADFFNESPDVKLVGNGNFVFEEKL